MKSSKNILLSSFILTAFAVFFIHPADLNAQKKSKDGKMTICHFPPGNPENVQTITIDESAWEAHQAHGDEIGGNCEKKSKKFNKISICHYPPGNPENVQTITIDADAWEAHEAHGDTKGTCVVNPPVTYIEVCHENEEIMIPENEWAAHEAHGDVQGKCPTTPPPPTITICHEGETRIIPENEWPAHESHGDTKGNCVVTPPVVYIKICHENEEIMIDENDWAAHESHGDNLGECQEYEVSTATMPEQKVTVCEGDVGVLPVEFTGIGPWDITYTNGTKEVTKEGITNSYFELEATEPGVYQITSVKDANDVEGLTSGESVLTINEAPDIFVEGVGTYCDGSPVTLTFNLSGNGPWTVNYTDGVQDFTKSTSEEFFTLTTQTSTTYRVKSIKDALCQTSYETEVTAVVEMVTKPSAFISGGGDICEGGEAELKFEMAGAGPWTVTYSNGEDTRSFTSTKREWTEKVGEGGIYKILSVNNEFCSTGGTGEVNLIGVSEISGEISINESYCKGEEVSIGFSPQAAGDYNVVWEVKDPNDGEFLNEKGSLVIFRPSESATDIEFIAHINNQCFNADLPASTTITKFDGSYTVEPADEKLVSGKEYTFTANMDGADDYTWHFGNETRNGQSVNYTFENANPSFNIILALSYTGGCDDDFKDTRSVANGGVLYIPSVFNPFSTNNENKVVKVYAEDVSETNFVFEIYNRWGLKVYETTSFQTANESGWNGINQSNSEMSENGVYTFILRGEFINGDKFERKGTITLVK